MIKSIENEGQRENYCGMHQWNLRADDSGLWLSSRASEDINLFDLVPLSGFELRYVNSPTDSFRMFELLGFKKGKFGNPSVAVCLRSILARFSSIFSVSHRRPRADQAVVRSARRIRRHWQRS